MRMNEEQSKFSEIHQTRLAVRGRHRAQRLYPSSTHVTLAMVSRLTLSRRSVIWLLAPRCPVPAEACRNFPQLDHDPPLPFRHQSTLSYLSHWQRRKRSNRKRLLTRSRLRWEVYTKIDLQMHQERGWTRLIWLRIDTSSGLLWTR